MAAAALIVGFGTLSQSLAQQPTGGKPAAIVNGEQISMAELDSVIQQAGTMPVEMPEDVKKQVRRQALAMLIDDSLMHQFINTKTPPLPKGAVEAKLAEMQEELRKKNKTFDQFCKETGQTREGVAENITYMLRWMAWAKSKVSDADLQRHYLENKVFFDGVTVRASHIVLRVPPAAPEADRARATAQLREIRQQILEGKLDFATAAKNYSECPSKEQGGDLGFFQRKFMLEEPFAKTAFAMQPGQISDVVQTEYGLHVLKVTDRKPGQESDFNKIKDQVLQFFTEELRVEVLTNQRKTAKIEVSVP